MKAIIVEINEKQAVALCKNGDFIRVKKQKNFEVGNEADINSVNIFRMSRLTKAVSAAAALLFVAGLGYGIYSYNAPYSYLNVDINPSVEITANIYDRIISIKPLNEDGSKLIELGSYKNKKLEDGVEELLQDARDKGYFNDEKKNAVMITVSGKNEEKVAKVEDEVKSTAETEVKKADTDTEVVVEKVTLARHVEAGKLGISPGKMLLIDRLKAVSPEIKAEDYINKPVKEIMSAIKEKRKENKDTDKKVQNSEKDTAQSSTTDKADNGKKPNNQGTVDDRNLERNNNKDNANNRNTKIDKNRNSSDRFHKKDHGNNR
jgi:hypothetical protein